MPENVYAPPKAAVADAGPTSDHTDVHFFAVSPIKLILMATCTLGFYQIYWIYKQWALVKERFEPDIIPWARTLFSVFWYYNCLKYIREDEQRLGIEPTLAAGPLAVGWIALSLTSRLHPPYQSICFLTPLLLVPVQQHINRINSLVAPDHDRNNRLSGWNWVAVAVGVVLIGLILFGLTHPEPRAAAI